VTGRQTPEQIERRRARDRVNKAKARAVARGGDPGEIPGQVPALRRVVLPVSRAPQGWQDQAACRTSPPDWFDAETDQNAARALAVCAGCPVRRDCFAAAAADRAASGVWGGVDLSAPHRQAVAS
jgi:WhiB family redox-sensing transcriptional regulator